MQPLNEMVTNNISKQPDLELSKKMTKHYTYINITFWISYSIIFGFATVLLQSKGFKDSQIGVVLSLASIFSIILQPIIAAYADKGGKISLRQLTSLIMILSFILTATLILIPNLFWPTATLYTAILTVQFSLPSLINGLAFEVINKNIPINYGLAKGIGSISFAIISYLVGVACAHYGPKILLPIFLVLYLSAIISIIRFKHENHSDILLTTDEANIKSGNDTPLSMFQFIKSYPKFMLFLLGYMLIFICHNYINSYMIRILEHVGGNEADLGLSLAIAAALELPTMAAFIFIIKKVKCSLLLKVSAFFFVIKIIILYLAPNVIMVYFSQTIQLLTFALFAPSSVYYVNSLMKNQDKIKGQAILGAVTVGLAGFLGNMIGGKILDTKGVPSLLLLGIILTIIGFIIVLFSTEEINV